MFRCTTPPQRCCRAAVSLRWGPGRTGPGPSGRRCPGGGPHRWSRGSLVSGPPGTCLRTGPSAPCSGRRGLGPGWAPSVGAGSAVASPDPAAVAGAAGAGSAAAGAFPVFGFSRCSPPGLPAGAVRVSAALPVPEGSSVGLRLSRCGLVGAGISPCPGVRAFVSALASAAGAALAPGGSVRAGVFVSAAGGQHDGYSEGRRHGGHFPEHECQSPLSAAHINWAMHIAAGLGAATGPAAQIIRRMSNVVLSQYLNCSPS